MKSYIVIGLGRFGTEVARQLCALGCEVLAVDSQSELVQQISGDVTHAVVADARDKGVLKALGAKEFDCAVVAIGGIGKENMAELGGTGVDGVALVSAIFAAEDIESECRMLKKMSEEMVNA